MNLYAQSKISPAELDTCKRVAKFFRTNAVPYLADINDDGGADKWKKRNNPYSWYHEFFIIFYPTLVKKYDDRLVFAIRDFAKGLIEANELKAVCMDYIKAHTVAWRNGIAYWKVLEME